MHVSVCVQQTQSELFPLVKAFFFSLFINSSSYESRRDLRDVFNMKSLKIVVKIVKKDNYEIILKTFINEKLMGCQRGIAGVGRGW